jgi:hypothetical protein
MKRLTALLVLTLLVGFPASRQDVIKVGVIAPFTGRLPTTASSSRPA